MTAATKPRERPYLATFGVFLGAGIVSLMQRVLSAGLPDLRGALGLGVDEAAWIPTASNMGLMFMGPFSVYLAALFGVRRVLLIAAPVFGVMTLLSPLAPSLGWLLALQAVAGLASGTFYPLALSFALANLPPRHIVYGIGAYSMELVATLSLGTPLQAWFADHVSWRWTFWHGVPFALAIMWCVYRAVPSRPRIVASAGTLSRVSWMAFLFASAGLSLFVGALEQGERLDWFRSRTIVAMIAAGGLLVSAAIVRRLLSPNPLVNVSFLARRGIALLGTAMFSLRFALLAVTLLIPAYLGTVAGYRPLQTGAVLEWLFVPEVAGGFVAQRLLRQHDGRLVAGGGFAAVGAAALMDARLSSEWSGSNFLWPQVVMAVGLAFVFVGLIGMIAQEAQVSQAVTHPVNLLAFGAFFQTTRLFGGEAGTAFMQHLLAVRHAFHSNVLAPHIDGALVDERVQAIAGGLYNASSGLDESRSRALAELAVQVDHEAYTLTYTDGFIIVAWLCATTLVCLALVKRTPRYFDAPAVAPNV
jgi:DHA2 family multidrug resistance protein